ncbi:MAG: TRAP transporter small permease [Planctomycetota bacterium]|nr:MAG: TRAP transporter small permease [Planctomycetota bacterium]
MNLDSSGNALPSAGPLRNRLRFCLTSLHRLSTRIVHYTQAILRLFLFILLVVMIIDVSTQVALRQIDKYFEVSTSTGKTEEMPALLLIWVALIGGSLAVSERSHPSIDALVRLFSRNWRLINDQFVYGCMIAFSAIVLLWGGFKLTIFTFNTEQITPAWELPMAYVYLALPLAGILNLIYLMHMCLTSLLRLLGEPVEDGSKVFTDQSPLSGSE